MKNSAKITQKILPRAQRGKDMVIDYGQTMLDGWDILIGMTGDRLCFAGFTDDAEMILDYYPQARLTPNPQKIAAMRGCLESAWRNDDLAALSYYVEGTAFQLDVWKTLLTIGLKKSQSYLEIAKRLNRPKAMRAVGNAVGANPVSLFIPCHRVMHSSGNKMGYGWGVDVKKKLLACEAAF